MKVSLIGTSLLGAVIAASLAEYGHQVTWFECLHEKHDRPLVTVDNSLLQLLQVVVDSGFLTRTTALDFTQQSDVYIFANEGHDSDLFRKIIERLGHELSPASVLMINTATLGLHGTASLQAHAQDQHWAYLPDVIQEGRALESFRERQQLLVGIETETAEAFVKELFRPLFPRSSDYLCMPILAAEFTKMSISGILAARISYMNDLAQVTERLGVDIGHVQSGLGSDSRIGNSYLSSGMGFGGEKFSHDILMLTQTVSEMGVKSHFLEQVWQINQRQKEILFRKLWQHFEGELTGKTIAIWGAAFKENSDSVAEAPVHVLLEALWAQGVKVQLHDPQALPQIAAVYGHRDDLILFQDQYDALQQADALCLVTAWHQYYSPDWDRVRSLMQQALVFDGRNIYNPKFVQQYGFEYHGIGRIV